MIFGFILVVALGVILVQLGSYSVWVTVLTIALKSVLLVLAVIAALFIGKRAFTYLKKSNFTFNRPKFIPGKVIREE